MGIPARALASILGHKDQEYANLALGKMVDQGFLRLVARGGPAAVKRAKLLGERVNPRMPSIYRFIGRVVNGVIEGSSDHHGHLPQLRFALGLLRVGGLHRKTRNQTDQ